MKQLEKWVGLAIILCLYVPVSLQAQTGLVFKDSIGIGTAGTQNGAFTGIDGLAVSPDGFLFVADNGNDRVQKFDKDGNYVSQFGERGDTDGKFKGPTDIAIDSKGNIWVTDRFNYRVQKFDKDGKFLKAIGTTQQSNANGDFDQPTGIAIDAADNVYVVDRTNDRIQKLNNEDEFIKVIGKNGAGDGEFETPQGIAVDKDANIYVVDVSHAYVQKFDSSGVFKAKIGIKGTGDGKFSVPVGIAIHPTNNNVYVSDITTDSIQVFNNKGDFIEKFSSIDRTGRGGDWFEGYLAFDTNGSLYIAARFSHNVYIYATPSEINLKEEANNIVSGGTVDFGNVIVGQSSDKTFTIENQGGAYLTLSGTAGNLVALGGDNATNFVITQTNVVDSITGFDNVTFNVTYKPSGTGISNVTLTISNNDTDEGNYVINLKGNATSNVTSLSKSLSEDIITMGPNPATQYLNIYLKGNILSNIPYKLISTQGQVVASGMSKLGKIDLSSLTSGNYLLIVQLNGKQIRYRVQKK